MAASSACVFTTYTLDGATRAITYTRAVCVSLPPKAVGRSCRPLQPYSPVSASLQPRLLCVGQLVLWSSVFSATIIKVAYGVEVAAADDPIIGLMVQTVKGLQGFAPGQFLVHYLPILRFVPLWVPLLGSQLRELARCRAAADKVKQVTFDKTRDDLVGALCHAMHSQ